jgi:hypothetical protein
MLPEMKGMVILLEWKVGVGKRESQRKPRRSSFEYKSESEGLREIEFNH